MQTKNSNSILNNRRNKEVKAGKVVLEQQLKVERKLRAEASDTEDDEDDDDDEDDEGEDKNPEVTPKKSKSQSKPTTPAKGPSPPTRWSSSKILKSSTGKRGQNVKFELEETPTKRRRQMPTRSGRRPIDYSENNAAATEDATFGSLLTSRPAAPAASSAADNVQAPPFNNVEYLDDVGLEQLEVVYQGVTTDALENMGASSQGFTVRSQSLELERRYRLILCDLLGVDRSYAIGPTLGLLRLYARAHYSPLRSFSWFHRDMPREYTQGFYAHLFDHAGRSRHLAEVYHDLVPLALARGDAWYDGYGNIQGAPLRAVQALPIMLEPVQQRALGFDVEPLVRSLDARRSLGAAAQDPRN